MISTEEDIFKRGSTTFFGSSKLFPSKIRDDITLLYSFLRVVDDLVDRPKPDEQTFNKIYATWKNKNTDFLASKHQKIVENILYLSDKYNFKTEWLEAFFDSMKADLSLKKYKSFDDILEYTYGSAEIVGLMLCRIFNLPKQAEKYAATQGRAWQWLNFIRDIEKDIKLSRYYFPQEELEKFGLKDLQDKSGDFSSFVRFQLKRYEQWQKEAYKGYDYIPKDLRVAVSAAAAKYELVAKNINENPQIIFKSPK